MHPGISLFLCGLLLTLWVFPAEATRVRRLSLSELRDTAHTIIVGVVRSSSTRTGPEGKMVWTDYVIEVEETLAGDAPGNPTTISFAGGQNGALDIEIVGTPRPVRGERYVFFLYPPGTWASATVGWGQGLFRVVEVDIEQTRTQTILVSYDQEPLEVAQTGELSRGAPVQVQDHTLRALSTQRLSTPEDPRAPEPTVLDADGKPLPQTPAVRQPVARLAERHFATLDDLRVFVQNKR